MYTVSLTLLTYIHPLKQWAANSRCHYAYNIVFLTNVTYVIFRAPVKVSHLLTVFPAL